MQENRLKTGTTTVGIIGKDSIVLAADMKATLGNISYEQEAKKIYKITEHIAATNAGSVGDSLTIIRFLRAHAKMYETEHDKPIKPKAIATLLSNILNANRFFPYMAQFIIAGFVDKPEMYEVLPYGDLIERDKFATSGSGTELALAVLDSEYKEGLKEEDAIKLAIKAIDASRRRDVFTGGLGMTVWVINKKGIRELQKKEIEKYTKALKIAAR